MSSEKNLPLVELKKLTKTDLDNQPKEDQEEERAYSYDDGVESGEPHQKLNIKNEPKIPVYPQQKALANNIMKRLQLSQKDQGLDFSRFKSVDVQVSIFFFNIHQIYYLILIQYTF